jgi:hypothetical protein
MHNIEPSNGPAVDCSESKIREETRKGFEECLTAHRNLEVRQRVGGNRRRSTLGVSSV